MPIRGVTWSQAEEKLRAADTLYASRDLISAAQEYRAAADMLCSEERAGRAAHARVRWCLCRIGMVCRGPDVVDHVPWYVQGYRDGLEKYLVRLEDLRECRPREYARHVLRVGAYREFEKGLQELGLTEEASYARYLWGCHSLGAAIRSPWRWHGRTFCRALAGFVAATVRGLGALLVEGFLSLTCGHGTRPWRWLITVAFSIGVFASAIHCKTRPHDFRWAMETWLADLRWPVAASLAAFTSSSIPSPPLGYGPPPTFVVLLEACWGYVMLGVLVALVARRILR